MRRRPRSQRKSLRGWCSRARHLAFALRGCTDVFAVLLRKRCEDINRGRGRPWLLTAWLLDCAQWHAERAYRSLQTRQPHKAAFHDRWSAFHLAAFDALVYGYAERRDEAARLARSA